MTLHHSGRGRLGLALGAFGASALLLAGCAGGGGGTGTDDAASGEPLIVGTTDKVTTLDPAGSYDNGSLAVQTQVFPYLVNTNYNETEVVPDLAETAEFTSPDRVHGDASRGPEVVQRQRPDLGGRQVLLRPQPGDRRPERRIEPALQPRQRRGAR